MSFFRRVSPHKRRPAKQPQAIRKYIPKIVAVRTLISKDTGTLLTGQKKAARQVLRK